MTADTPHAAAPAAAGRPNTAAPAAPGTTPAEAAVRLGTFDAERHWRPDGLAELPAVRDPGADAAVAAMDELLAVACRPGDLLVTGAAPPESLSGALAGAGLPVAWR
ncbi:hypothetical protein RKE29_28630, partial [Streptomyces sp. B1866]|nr:hypothetical protein [Streptomyces sp. B1866]